MVADDPESFADLDGHQGSQPSPNQTTACNVSGNSSNSCIQQQSQVEAAAEQQAEGTSTVTTIGTRKMTVVYNSDDNTTTTTTVTTAAYFNHAVGHEGEYLGTQQTTTVVTESAAPLTTGGGRGVVLSSSTSTKSLDLKTAVSVLGTTAFRRGQERAARPDRGAYNIGQIRADAKEHPYRYAFHAVGLALPLLKIGELAEGLVTAGEALHTAYDLVRESN